MQNKCELDLPFSTWFKKKGWEPYDYQLELIKRPAQFSHDVLIAPTGGGKTLAGFLPSLIDLLKSPYPELHTIYISPLKALAEDVARNLTIPIEEMNLRINVDVRTGDTSNHRKRAQMKTPPQILLTTPESFALLLSYPEAKTLMSFINTVIIDEIHAIINSKRGDQLSLCLARLQKFSPSARRIGLSATVSDTDHISKWIAPADQQKLVRTITATPGPPSEISIVKAKRPPPWSGHSGQYALPELMEEIKKNKTTLIFVNTRAQAEIIFQSLWELNDECLPIGLHHGSLSVSQRTKIENAMAKGDLKAIIATSSLDLGVDWSSVQLVVQIGAPKGISRLIQRVGRSNHVLSASSRAILIPTNLFEVIECQAAIEAIIEGDIDDISMNPGAIDVLAQHLLLMACSQDFQFNSMHQEVSSSFPYRNLDQDEFKELLNYASNGGYVLQSYEQWRKIDQKKPGIYGITSKSISRKIRMNVGTIVEAETLRVKKKRGEYVGTVEEQFIQSLSPGDTFILGGKVWSFVRIKDLSAEVTSAEGKDPKVPIYAGGKLPLNSSLARRVRKIISDPVSWNKLPNSCREWLELQKKAAHLPKNNELLVETFPRAGKWYMVTYSFAGRNANQTLGLLLTKQMEFIGLAPLGFVVNDYALTCWGLRPIKKPEVLFNQDALYDGIDPWLEDSSLLKRTFRQIAIVSGLIQRRFPTKNKTGKQITFNSDIIYDTLRKYEPNHILLKATRNEALRGLADLSRIEQLLELNGSNIRHIQYDRTTPLAVPLILEVGKEPVYGGHAEELLLQSLAYELFDEAKVVNKLKKNETI